MSMEEALKKLEYYADILVNVGDAKIALKTNKSDFLGKLNMVGMYYRYIEEHGDLSTLVTMDGIMEDIVFKNPSLTEWVELILEPTPVDSKKNTNNKENENISLFEITGPLEFLISEVKDMQSFDPEHMENVKYELEKYKNILIANKGKFELNVYDSFISDIDASLEKIDRLNNLVNSDKMQF